MNALTNVDTNALRGFIEDLSLVRIPPWWQSPWFMLAALLGLAALVLAGRRLYLRWALGRPAPGPAPGAPQEPPHLVALRQLEALRRRVDELGAYRLAIDCSWVLRRYIEARFRLEIVYQTTREFLGHANTQQALSSEQRNALGQYLGFCDMIKFARQQAGREETIRLVDHAISFVKACATTASPDSAGVRPSEALKP